MEKLDIRLRGVETSVAVSTQKLDDFQGVIKFGIGVLLTLGISFAGYVVLEIRNVDSRLISVERQI